MIEQILVFGLISGGIYALLALGFTLIYGVSGVVNLAHGSLYMIGAYMFFVFNTLGFFTLTPFTEIDPILGPILALIFAVLLTGLLSSIMYRLTIHPVLGDEIGVMVVTVCLALIIQQLIQVIPQFGSANVPVSFPIEGSINILGVNLTLVRVLVFWIAIFLFMLLWLFINGIPLIGLQSKFGNAMRAVSQDREAAMLMGINTDRLYILTMALSAMLAGIAGILYTASHTGYAAHYIWLNPLAFSFSIVILGGLGSIKGSLLGGFILGYAAQTVAIVVPEGGAIISVVPFTVMVIVLLIRPKGLFGKRVEMED